MRVHLLHPPDAVRVVTGAAVGQIVPVHGGKHHVLEVHQLHGTRRIDRLLEVQPAPGVAGVHSAEATGTGTDIAHQHDSGGSGAPALAHIGAFGLFAHGGKPMFADNSTDLFVVSATLHADAEPVGLAWASADIARGFYAVFNRRDAPVIDELLAAGVVASAIFHQSRRFSADRVPATATVIERGHGW